MANIKISELNALTEKEDSDLLAIVDTSTEETKKIQVSDLLDKNIELIAVSDTAPSQCSVGDKYYNTTDKEIYTATDTNTWSETGTTPISGILYIVYNEQASYSWDGTDLVSVGGGKEDIVIDDEEPTDPDVKLWIDTGEVQNSGKEVNIGTEIDSKVGLNVIVNKELFTNLNLTNGYLNNDGTITTNNEFSVSDYINVNGMSSITIANNSGSSEKICFYNSSKTLVSYVNTSTNATMTITVPSDAYYVRATVKNTNLGVYQMQKGSSIVMPKIYANEQKIYEKFKEKIISGTTSAGGNISLGLNYNNKVLGVYIILTGTNQDAVAVPYYSITQSLWYAHVTNNSLATLQSTAVTVVVVYV